MSDSDWNSDSEANADAKLDTNPEMDNASAKPQCDTPSNEKVSSSNQSTAIFENQVQTEIETIDHQKVGQIQLKEDNDADMEEKSHDQISINNEGKDKEVDLSIEEIEIETNLKENDSEQANKLEEQSKDVGESHENIHQNKIVRQRQEQVKHQNNEGEQQKTQAKNDERQAQSPPEKQQENQSLEKPLIDKSYEASFTVLKPEKKEIDADQEDSMDLSWDVDQQQKSKTTAKQENSENEPSGPFKFQGGRGNGGFFKKSGVQISAEEPKTFQGGRGGGSFNENQGTQGGFRKKKQWNMESTQSSSGNFNQFGRGGRGKRDFDEDNNKFGGGRGRGRDQEPERGFGRGIRGIFDRSQQSDRGFGRGGRGGGRGGGGRGNFDRNEESDRGFGRGRGGSRGRGGGFGHDNRSNDFDHQERGFGRGNGSFNGERSDNGFFRRDHDFKENLNGYSNDNSSQNNQEISSHPQNNGKTSSVLVVEETETPINFNEISIIENITPKPNVILQNLQEYRINKTMACHPIGLKCWPSVSVYIRRTKVSVYMSRICDHMCSILFFPYTGYHLNLHPGNIINQSPFDYKKKLKERQKPAGQVYFQKSLGIKNFIALAFTKIEENSDMKQIMKKLLIDGKKINPQFDSILIPYSKQLGPAPTLIEGILEGLQEEHKYSEIIISTNKPEQFIVASQDFLQMIKDLAENNQIVIE